jgi:hypothetical protein
MEDLRKCLENAADIYSISTANLCSAETKVSPETSTMKKSKGIKLLELPWPTLGQARAKVNHT